jgi:hypothetical protein
VAQSWSREGPEQRALSQAEGSVPADGNARLPGRTQPFGHWRAPGDPSTRCRPSQDTSLSRRNTLLNDIDRRTCHVEPTAEDRPPAPPAAPRRPEGEGAEHAGTEAAEAARRGGIGVGLALAQVGRCRRFYSKMIARPAAFPADACSPAEVCPSRQPRDAPFVSTNISVRTDRSSANS